MARILYISYWGGLEPLGQSLILPALYKLSEMGAEITFISFDKPHDLNNKSEFERVKADMKRYNINWYPLLYHKKPRIPSTLFDISHGVVRGIIERIKKRPDVIHARCYVGGLIGMSLSKILRTKWLYHNEGFYPDEMVDGGFWEEGSRMHKLTKSCELKMYGDADGIISVSYRGKQVIDEMPKVAKKKTPVVAVPSCVDLARFSLRETTPEFDGKLKLVYVGNIGGRYMVTELAKFANLWRKIHGDESVHLQIFSRLPFEEVKLYLEPSDLPLNNWSVESIPYIEMTNRLSEYHSGSLFLTQGISEHGCSPTKTGEYWAKGLPILTTPNISDTDDIIRSQKVGVIVEGHSEEAYKKAIAELKVILSQPDLSARCRCAAEGHYALIPACERQMKLYDAVINNKRADSLVMSQSLD
jgi:glycosyltransferase involved in cell wall biosynthesis